MELWIGRLVGLLKTYCTKYLQSGSIETAFVDESAQSSDDSQLSSTQRMRLSRDCCDSQLAEHNQGRRRGGGFVDFHNSNHFTSVFWMNYTFVP